jgi:hypothetical protein
LKPPPHPAPFQSALWEHVDLIRKLRLARKTWPKIAAELGRMGVRINRSTVRRFFKRLQGRKEMPLGLEQKAVRLGSVTVRDSAPDLPPKSPNGIDPLLLETDPDDPWTPKGRKN